MGVRRERTTTVLCKVDVEMPSWEFLMDTAMGWGCGKTL